MVQHNNSNNLKEWAHFSSDDEDIKPDKKDSLEKPDNSDKKHVRIRKQATSYKRK